MMWTLLAIIPLLWLWVHGRSQRKKLAEWQKLSQYVRVCDDGTSSVEINIPEMRMRCSPGHPERRDECYHVRRTAEGTWECLLAAPSRQARVDVLEELLATSAEKHLAWEDNDRSRLEELRKRGWEPLGAEDATAVEAQFQRLIAISRPGWKPRTWG